MQCDGIKELTETLREQQKIRAHLVGDNQKRLLQVIKELDGKIQWTAHEVSKTVPIVQESNTKVQDCTFGMK